MKNLTATILTLFSVLFVTAAVAQSGSATIEMLNKLERERFVYSPAIVHIAPGETVDFIATDKGHNAVSISGMLPEGATPITIPFNKNASIKFEKSGIYGLKCTPHIGLGMATLIIVGTPDNLNDVRIATGKLPAKARERVLSLLEQI